MKDTIENLAKKAGKAGADEAVQYSQAALNLANAHAQLFYMTQGRVLPADPPPTE